MQAWIPVVSSSLYFWKSVFSFRADSILKSDGDFISNWKFPDCVHFFGAWARQAVIETIAVVYEHTKRTQEMCSPIGQNNTKHFLCPNRSRIRLNFWKYLGESRYPGALSPVFENFRPTFSPEPTECPWVSEGGISSGSFFCSRKRIWVTGIVLFLFCPVTNIAPRRTFLYQMIFLVTFVVKLLFSFSKGSAISAAIADHIRLTCLVFLTFVVATITYIAT